MIRTLSIAVSETGGFCKEKKEKEEEKRRGKKKEKGRERDSCSIFF